MNRREALKRLVGTTIAVAVSLPFVPESYDYITDDTEELDRRAWWRENFTIQSVEHAEGPFGDHVRVVVTQNGRPNRVMYGAVLLHDTANLDDAIQEIKNAVAQHATRNGWVKRQTGRHIA